MVDHVESGTVDYIDDLDPAIPQESGTQVAYANDNLRNIKKAVQQSFPNVAGVVAADHTELGYCDGVTSAIQTQLDGKVSTTTGAMDDIAVDTDLLVGDTGNSRIGINQATPLYDLHVGDDGGSTGITYVNIEGDSSGQSRILLGDAAATTAVIAVSNASGNFNLLNSAALGVFTWTSSEIIINDGQGAYDFRVESDTLENGLFFDGSNNRLGIKQGTPLAELHVGDDTGTDSATIRIESNSTNGESSLQFGSSAIEYTIVYTNTDDTLRIERGSVDRIAIAGTETVFNDGGTTADFRVEGDTDPNMIFVDGANDRVGIGQGTPLTDLHVGDDSGSNSTTVTIESGSSAAKSIIKFGDAVSTASRIEHDNSNNAFSITQNSVERVNFKSTEVVFNDISNNYDFRVESNGNANMIFVDAGNDNVGIGKVPHASSTLDVAGAIYINGSPSDWVFEHVRDGKGYPKIEAHAEGMWKDNHLPWVDPFETEDGVQRMNIDKRMADILAELELAHIYIEDLHRRIKELENKK